MRVQDVHRARGPVHLSTRRHRRVGLRRRGPVYRPHAGAQDSRGADRMALPPRVAAESHAGRRADAAGSPAHPPAGGAGGVRREPDGSAHALIRAPRIKAPA